MNTVAEIIDRLGGGANVARILAVGPSTASEMKRRGSIPPAYWPALLASEKGREIGLTAETLMLAHPRKVQAAE
jgi:uroporphyrinogen-III synthase